MEAPLEFRLNSSVDRQCYSSASGSGRNGDLEVSSPSPSPTYIRLIRKHAAWVSNSEM